MQEVCPILPCARHYVLQTCHVGEHFLTLAEEGEEFLGLLVLDVDVLELGELGELAVPLDLLGERVDHGIVGRRRGHHCFPSSHIPDVLAHLSHWAHCSLGMENWFSAKDSGGMRWRSHLTRSLAALASSRLPMAQ